MGVAALAIVGIGLWGHLGGWCFVRVGDGGVEIVWIVEIVGIVWIVDTHDIVNRKIV